MKISRLALPLLLLFTIGVFCRVYLGAFLSLDDLRNIPQNPHLVAGQAGYFWTSAYYYLYAPVIYTVWTWLYQISSGPEIFHAANLALHLFNVALVFAIARRLGARDFAAWLAAALFALHPLQLEAVAWISAGRDQLSAAFGLLATWLFLKHWRWAASVAFTLGLLAKPGLVALPLALFCLVGRGRRWLVGWSGLGLAMIAITRAVQGSVIDSKLPPIDAWERVIVAFDALGFYFTKLVWPAGLSVDYARTPDLVLQRPSVALVGSSWIALLLIWRSARRELGFALAMLLPVLGLVPFIAQVQSTVSDRYVYVSMLGFALAAAKSRVPRALAGVLLVGLAWMTWSRVPVWRSNSTLFASSLEAQPNSYLSAVNLANEWVLAGRLNEAEPLLERARDLRPELATAYAALAQVYWVSGRPAKILGEIAPKVESPGFVLRNQEATLELSLLNLFTARAALAAGDRSRAARSYCAFRHINPGGAALNDFEALGDCH